jgi:hypothetical protein
MGILIAYLLGILTASKPKDHRAKHNADSSHPPQRQSPADGPLSVICITPTKSKEESAEEEKKKRRETIKFRVELTGAFVLVIYTAFTILMWCANKKAAEAAKSAADTAAKQLEMTDRPWVAIEVAITSPLIYDDKGVRLDFSFVPKNIGHSPAQNVLIAPELLPVFMGDDVSEAQKRICKSAAQDTVFPKYVLFPEEPYSQPFGLSMSTESIIAHWGKVNLG